MTIARSRSCVVVRSEGVVSRPDGSMGVLNAATESPRDSAARDSPQASEAPTQLGLHDCPQGTGLKGLSPRLFCCGHTRRVPLEALDLNACSPHTASPIQSGLEAQHEHTT